jgi:8-oxo-dGTP diphosphatase
MTKSSMIDPLDLVRDLYRAINRGDIDGIAAFYHPTCIVERVFSSDPEVTEGREIVRLRWAAELERHRGSLAGGHRFQVRCVAGMQTGWGWVRADWLSAVHDTTAGAERRKIGYSHFWIEDGLIRRQRDVVGGDASRSEATARTRPVVGVGAVIVMRDGRVVLVRRKHEPLAGQWSLPGGTLELGETLEAGTAREVFEETGLVVDVGPVVDVFDRILVDETGRVRYHFVLVDYLCQARSDAVVAGSDVDAVALADPAALDGYRLTEKAQAVIAKALQMSEGHS